MQQPNAVEPPLPEGIDAADLDPEARRDLRGLQKDTADTVARHLVAAGTLIDENPEQALLHARFARRRASRIAVVREAAGIAAYHAGEWNEALGELRAARRMGGGPGHLAVMADIERALGRPERALELARGPEVRELGRAEAIELAIVAAGARRDLGELDAAVVGLQIPELDPSRRDPWSVRLFYAYADNLLAAGRESDALQWFVHTVDADTDGETDADHRLADLTGEPLPDDDGVYFDIEESVLDAPMLEVSDSVPDESGNDAMAVVSSEADDDAEVVPGIAGEGSDSDITEAGDRNEADAEPIVDLVEADLAPANTDPTDADPARNADAAGNAVAAGNADPAGETDPAGNTSVAGAAEWEPQNSSVVESGSVAIGTDPDETDSPESDSTELAAVASGSVEAGIVESGSGESGGVDSEIREADGGQADGDVAGSVETPVVEDSTAGGAETAARGEVDERNEEGTADSVKPAEGGTSP